MPEETAKIIIEVEARGAENVKKAGDNLGKLNDTTTRQTRANKELKGGLDLLNLGFMTNASYVGMAAGAFGMLAKATLDYNSGIVSFGANVNNVTKSTWDYGTTLQNVREWSMKFNVTQGEVEQAMTIFNNVTHDTTTSLGLLKTATELHNATGMSTKQIAQDMADAYTKFGVVVDKNTGAYLPANVTALQQVIANLKLMENQTGQTKAAMGTFFGRAGEFAGSVLTGGPYTGSDTQPRTWQGPYMSGGGQATSSQAIQVIIQAAPSDEIADAIAKSLDVKVRMRGANP